MGFQRPLLTAIAVVLLGGCTSAPNSVAEDTSSPDSIAEDTSASPDPLPTADRIADGQALLAEVLAAAPCSVSAGPTDLIQSPFAVERVACNADNTRLYVYGEDGDARRYQMQQTEIGSGVSRGFLVGPNWLVVAPPATLESVQDRIGGGLFTDKAAALAATPGMLIDDPYPDCHVSFTAGAVEYVRSGNDVIAALDAVYPGMHDLFVELVQPTVRSLPAFASGDFALVDEQLEPHAGLLREVCRAMFPAGA